MLAVRWRAVFLRIGLVVFSLLFTLTVSEASLQLAFRLRDGVWPFASQDAFSAHFTTPVKDRRLYSLRPGYADEMVTVGPLGFREPFHSEPSSELVVALGDSVPFGAGVRDEETYPHYLDGRLRAEGCDSRVLNAGVPSYNLRQSLDRLEIDVLSRYTPSVVLLHASNDATLLAQFGDEWSPDVTWADLRWAQFWGARFDRFAIGRLVRGALSADPPEESFGRFANEGLTAFLRTMLIERLSIIADSGVRVILLPINPFYYQTANADRNPSLHASSQPNFEAYHRATDETVTAVNGVLREVADSVQGVEFIDVRVWMDDVDRAPLYIDYLHHTAEGNQMLADRLAEQMLRERFACVAARGEGP